MAVTSPALTQYLTLVANTAATVSLSTTTSYVTVTNRDGLAELFFTVDGTTPVVAAAGTYHISALAGAFVRVPVGTTGVVTVRAISTGTPQISIDPTSLNRSSGSAPVVPVVAATALALVSLNATAVSANGASLDTVTGRPNHTMQVALTDTVDPTAISTQLQGSLDNVGWFNLGAAVTNTVPGVYSVSVTGAPVRYLRAITTITGGTTVALTARLLSTP